MKYASDPMEASNAKAEAMRAVICGSFKRDPAGLERDYTSLLAAGCTILSPTDLDFVANVQGFVYGSGDLGKSTRDIERRHLSAMLDADLIWLHCPDGYVGSSAAMELGYAQALGLRVFASEAPVDVTLCDFVQVVPSPGTATTTVRTELGPAPTDALPALQRYYTAAALMRGWSEETAAQTVGLLRGEIKEFEEALTGENQSAAALELADVQLYVVHLANILGIDLAEAVTEKERQNSERFAVADERLAA